MKWTQVNPDSESIQSVRRRWKMYGGRRDGPFRRDWARNAIGQPCHFYCRICYKDVSILTHDPHKSRRHSNSANKFRLVQRFSFETPGWQWLDFERNTLGDDELERQWGHPSNSLGHSRIEYFFARDLFVDNSGTPDATQLVLFKVSSIEVLRLRGNYEHVHQLWSQFDLNAGWVNIDVAWSHDEVLVSVLLVPYF